MASLDGTITISNNEYRPCMIGSRKALFHQWVTGSGINALAIVEYEYGQLETAYLGQIRFLDSGNLFQERSIFFQNQQ